MSFYSVLLHLYPASFRAEYGEEMSALFRARQRDATTTSARALLWLDTIVEVLMNALGVHWDILRQDLWYTARTLVRSPGFALTAILVTALGIGANTAAFSVADFVLIRPLPYADADRLVKLWQRPRDGGTNELSPFVYREWKTSKSFEAVGGLFTKSANLVGQGEPRRLETASVTSDLLPILGVQPIRGRLFNADDARSSTGAIVISHALWQSQFAEDDNVLGRQVSVDGTPRVVIGVMPADFHFPNRDIAIWAPATPDEENDTQVSNNYWNALGKLREGVTVQQATSELNAIEERIRRQYPDDIEEGSGAFVNPLRSEFSSQSRVLLLALSAASACVLLIACANLANLLLARALTRRRDLLVRAALGAGRERLVRQSITESIVLAVLGGALGVGIAVVAVPLLTRLVPTTLPIAQAPAVDIRIMMFAMILTAITGVGFGIVPAWRSAGKLDLSGMRDGARAGGGRKDRARSALVIAEIMASVVLLISAGLLMRALVQLQDTNPGFTTDNVLTLRTALPLPRYDSTARRAAFYHDVMAEVRALPGVTSAAYISGLPMVMSGGVWGVVPEGTPDSDKFRNRASSRFVTPGYFATLNIPLKAGRDISDNDETDLPHVAVVSESFVKRHYPNVDPLGRRFDFNNDMRTIVGVVGDVRVRGVERKSEPQVYLSYKQVQNGQSNFYYPKDMVIRGAVPAASLLPAVRQIVQRVDPEQPISNVRMLSDVVADGVAARSVQVRVLGAFAIIAFLLAGIGIHGLLSFSVSSRQHEIGVRMALGAQRSEIMHMVMRRGIVLAAAGVIPGVALAYVAARAMQSLLAGINPGDAMTFGAAGVLCVIMTLAGSFFPTLRAVRVDPATAFRAES